MRFFLVRDFWEICEDRYQVRSLILTSQLLVARRHEQISDPTVADGILDRLIHIAHRIEMGGDSMRKSRAKPNAYWRDYALAKSPASSARVLLGDRCTDCMIGIRPVVCEGAVRSSTSKVGRAKLRKLSFLAGLGAYVLFLLLLICITAGIIISFGDTPRPKPLGWITFIAGSVLALWTVPRWARILPGVFGPAALNGIIILSTGHALNQPSVPFPRWQALLFTILMVIGSLTTAPFTKKGLSRTDQVACIGLLSCFVAGFTAIALSIERWEGPIGIAILAFLGLIWTGRAQGRKVGGTGTGAGFADGHL